MTVNKSNITRLMVNKGFLDILPFNLAVLPWGLLCGSLAIQRDFSIVEALLMPLLVFAGAVQLVTIELMADNAPLSTIIFTTFIISFRHFLYGITLREKLKGLPNRWRISLGFLLTDELFALIANNKALTKKHQLAYALSAGGSFYLSWFIWNLLGVVAGSYLPDLTDIGLDFAIAVTFIALVIPTVTNLPVLITVVVAGLFSVIFKLLNWEIGLVFSSIIAMSIGYCTSELTKTKLFINKRKAI